MFGVTRQTVVTVAKRRGRGRQGQLSPDASGKRARTSLTKIFYD